MTYLSACMNEPSDISRCSTAPPSMVEIELILLEVRMLKREENSVSIIVLRPSQKSLMSPLESEVETVLSPKGIVPFAVLLYSSEFKGGELYSDIEWTMSLLMGVSVGSICTHFEANSTRAGLEEQAVASNLTGKSVAVIIDGNRPRAGSSSFLKASCKSITGVEVHGYASDGQRRPPFLPEAPWATESHLSRMVTSVRGERDRIR
mmetsp:Transcript_8072/g.16128  ORF Transcript_8072/g.16128 Transcript_8072/m.16128 type:complete len:206 (+) Transcript_8072:669-1286(+)